MPKTFEPDMMETQTTEERIKQLMKIRREQYKQKVQNTYKNKNEGLFTSKPI